MEILYYPSKDGETTIHAVIWSCEQPKGIVQIIHGMSEYCERYTEFAEFLNKQGYIVCAEDHLGHGDSISQESKRGYFCKDRDFKTVLGDIYSLTKHIKSKFPNLPFFVLGHSMGSFFCRNFISEYSNEIDGTIIMGSGFKSGLTTNTALLLTRISALFCGWEHRSKFIKNLAFGSYNKHFKEDSANAWLSKNQDNVRKYDTDRECGVDFTLNGYYILFSVIRAACSKKVIEKTRKDLPTLFVAGSDDPVGDYGKGVKKSFEKFKAAKMQNVSIKLFDDARHEILNDDCKQEVFDIILQFLDGKIGSKN